MEIFLETYATLSIELLNFSQKFIFSIFQALLLCFKLQESRIAVVSSTAAATLRQLVMFVVDKMVLEDQIEASKSGSKALTSLITTLKRLVTEKPAVLGIGSQMAGIGVQSDASPESSAAAYGLRIGYGRLGSERNGFWCCRNDWFRGWRIESTRVDYETPVVSLTFIHFQNLF